MSLNSFQERPQVSPDPPETPEKTVERHKLDVQASEFLAASVKITQSPLD